MKKKTLIIISHNIKNLDGCGTVKDTENSSNTLNQVSFEEGVYSVVVDRTELSWIGKEISTKIHTGTLNLSDGTIQIIDENTINGNITIDMSSINVTDLQGRAKEILEGHLRSAEFFEDETYPNATHNFKSKSYNKLKNLIDFEGQLTIKDISNPIFFSATLIESSPYLKAKSILSFDRSKYNVRFRSGSFFENLGDKLILDDIDVNIVLVTEKK